MFGSKDPEQVNTMAKQAGEVSFARLIDMLHNIQNEFTNLKDSLMLVWCF